MLYLLWYDTPPITFYGFEFSSFLLLLGETFKATNEKSISTIMSELSKVELGMVTRVNHAYAFQSHQHISLLGVLPSLCELNMCRPRGMYQYGVYFAIIHSN